MIGERRHKDYKLNFDYTSAKARTELVKDIVSIANSGGGVIVFGVNETSKPGIDARTVQELDSARIADLVEKYVKPSQFELGHNVTEISSNKFVFELTISRVEYPIVMSQQGNWKGYNTKEDKLLFRQGDIWTRHSTKNERIHYEDLKQWLQEAKKQERDDILEKFKTVVNLPKDAKIQYVTTSGQPLDTPKGLLENVLLRRKRDNNSLLDSKELLWLFHQREFSEYSDDELALLVGSALRRGATLFWWLIFCDKKTHIIMNEIDATLVASDRDKSDAARNIIELASVYAEDDKLLEIVKQLKSSRYKHFRNEGNAWKNRESTVKSLSKRVQIAKHEGKELLDYSSQELEFLATELAAFLMDKRSTPKARKLANINRALWIKRSSFGVKTQTNHALS